MTVVSIIKKIKFLVTNQKNIFEEYTNIPRKDCAQIAHAFQSQQHELYDQQLEVETLELNQHAMIILANFHFVDQIPKIHL